VSHGPRISGARVTRKPGGKPGHGTRHFRREERPSKGQSENNMACITREVEIELDANDIREMISDEGMDAEDIFDTRELLSAVRNSASEGEIIEDLFDNGDTVAIRDALAERGYTEERPREMNAEAMIEAFIDLSGEEKSHFRNALNLMSPQQFAEAEERIKAEAKANFMAKLAQLLA